MLISHTALSATPAFLFYKTGMPRAFQTVCACLLLVWIVCLGLNLV